MKRFFWIISMILIGVSWIWILRQLDWPRVWAALETARWGFLFPSTFLGVIVYGVLSYRWARLLEGRPHVVDTFSAFMVGVYANTLLPLRVGDLARSYLIHRRVPELPVLMILTSIGTGLMFDMLSLTILLPPALLLFPIPSGVAAGGIIIVLITLGLFSFGFYLARRPPFPPDTWRGQLQQGVGVLRKAQESFRLVALTILAYGLQGLANWWLLLTLDPDIPLAAGYVVMLGAALGFALPLLPGSVGTYETAITLTLTGVGLTTEEAVLATLFFRAQYNAIIIVVGSLATLREGVTLSDLRQLSEDEVHRSQSAPLGLS